MANEFVIKNGFISQGNSLVNGTLTATTISATTYQNLPVDPNTYVTAFTYNNNTFTLNDSSGSTFNATINTVTGWTVNGGLTVTGLIYTPIVQAHTSAGLTIEAQGGTDCALFGAGGGANVTLYGGVNLDASTADRILSTDASKNITALNTTTYPTLTELSYVKGVTSAIQTQINKRRSFVITTGNQTTTGASATTIIGLTASVDASSTYVFMGHLAVGCSTANGIRFTVTIPSGATMNINFFGNTTSTAAVLTQRVTTSGTLTTTAHARRAATDSFVTIFGTVTVAGTSGNVVFQYASATGGDTSTVYQEGTFINVTKI